MDSVAPLAAYLQSAFHYVAKLGSMVRIWVLVVIADKHLLGLPLIEGSIWRSPKFPPQFIIKGSRGGEHDSRSISGRRSPESSDGPMHEGPALFGYSPVERDFADLATPYPQPPQTPALISEPLPGWASTTTAVSLFQPLEVHDPFNSASQWLVLGWLLSAVLLALVFAFLHIFTNSRWIPFRRSPATQARQASNFETTYPHPHSQRQMTEETIFPTSWEITLEEIALAYTGKVLEDGFEQLRTLEKANKSLHDDAADYKIFAEKTSKDLEVKVEIADKARKDLEVKVGIADKARKDAEKAKEASTKKARDESAKSNSALATKDNTINKQQSQIAGLEGRITDLSKQIGERKDSAVTYRETIANNEEKISAQANEITRLTFEAGQKNTANRAKDAKNSTLLAENTKLGKCFNQAQTRIKELEGHVKRQNSNAEEAKSKAKKASDQELRRQLEEFKKKHADELHATASELADVRIQLDVEKAASADAQRMRTVAEQRVDAFMGELADVLKENGVLRATLDDMEKGKIYDEEEEDQELEQGSSKNIGSPSIGEQRGPDRLKYNRNKIRSNKRPDGSIYTSKHPRSTPPRMRSVAEQQHDIDQGMVPLDEHQHAHNESMGQGVTPASSEQVDTQEEGKPLRQVRRVCTFFQQGYCKFGAKCFNAHEIPTASESPSKPPEMPAQISAPASVQQADDQHDHRPPTPKPVTRICHFFKQGKCRFGANCRESHDLSASPEGPREPPEGKQGQPLRDQNSPHGRKGGSTPGYGGFPDRKRGARKR